MAMPKTQRHRKPKPVEQAAVMTVADYYRMRLTQVPIDPAPPSREDYLRFSAGAQYASPGNRSRSPQPQTTPKSPSELISRAKQLPRRTTWPLYGQHISVKLLINNPTASVCLPRSNERPTKMPTFATAADVQARLGRPLTADETTQVDTLLADTEILIKARISDLAEKAGGSQDGRGERGSASASEP